MLFDPRPLVGRRGVIRMRRGIHRSGLGRSLRETAPRLPAVLAFRDPVSTLFFVALAAAHMLLKVLLGLILVFSAFLLLSFATHTYFKSFVTYGLIRFNGASLTELLEYGLEAMSVYFAVYIASSTVEGLAIERELEARSATLLSILDLPIPPEWEGGDMLARGFDSGPTLIFARSTRLVNGIDGRYKFFYYLDDGTEHLYNLREDPREERNLAGARQEQIRRYKGLIGKWLAYQQGKITAR